MPAYARRAVLALLTAPRGRAIPSRQGGDPR